MMAATKLDGSGPFVAGMAEEAKRKLPQPPDILSDRIKSLLSKALLSPETLKPEEAREMAASVVMHLHSLPRT